MKKSSAVSDIVQPVGISIALTMGTSIAFVIHSVDRSFDLALALSKVGAQCAPYKMAIQNCTFVESRAKSLFE